MAASARHASARMICVGLVITIKDDGNKNAHREGGHLLFSHNGNLLVLLTLARLRSQDVSVPIYVQDAEGK